VIRPWPPHRLWNQPRPFRVWLRKPWDRRFCRFLLTMFQGRGTRLGRNLPLSGWRATPLAGEPETGGGGAGSPDLGRQGGGVFLPAGNTCGGKPVCEQFGAGRPNGELGGRTEGRGLNAGLWLFGPRKVSRDRDRGGDGSFSIVVAQVQGFPGLGAGGTAALQDEFMTHGLGPRVRWVEVRQGPSGRWTKKGTAEGKEYKGGVCNG